MTLDQYLGTVAWLWIAFLMWFSIIRINQSLEGYGDDMYWLMMKVGMKPKFSVLMFMDNIFVPSFFWALIVGIWVEAFSGIYITCIGG